MKKLIFLSVCMSAAFAGMQVNAQSKYGKPAAGAARTATRPDTTKPGAKPAPGVTALPDKPGTTTTPAPTTPETSGAAVIKTYDTVDAKPKIAIRNNYATDRSQIKDRKPLEYENLREDDNFWSEFIWREIDAREKINQPFMYQAVDDNGDQRFFSILINAIKNDSVTAFSPVDDRFTTPFSSAYVQSLVAGVLDSLDVTDPITGSTEKKFFKSPKFSPDSVYTFRIKEQLIFDKEASRLFTRIIGIAPIVKQSLGTSGKSAPRVLFWLYYPDLRKSFAKVDVYNPKNFSSRMTWEELFESRYFSSYIIKSSANNPGDKSLATMIKDPLFRLLEGENIHTRIFNWEQDLWQY